MKFFVLLIILIKFINIYSDDLNINGQNLLNYSYDNNNYFENWLNLNIEYKKIFLNIEYQAHLPPFSFSMDTSGQGIYKTTIGYKSKNTTIKAGDFYAIFGRGITLNSFFDRNLRWDNGIRGIFINYNIKNFTPTFIVGKMNTIGNRKDSIFYATDVKINLNKIGYMGFSLIKTENNLSWGGFYNLIKLPDDAELYYEIAINDLNNLKNFRKNNSFYKYKNRAIFTNLSIYSPISLIKFGYKDYYNFNISPDATYNSMPSLIKKHLFTLSSREEHIVDADDERGFLAELSPIWDYDAHTNLSFSYNTNHKNEPLYKELLWTNDGEILEDLGFNNEISWQNKPSFDYYTIATSLSKSINEKFSIKTIFEHQYTANTTKGNGFSIENKFYNQIYTISITKNEFATISVIDEYTSNKLEKSKNHIGIQTDFNFKKNKITIFAGQRSAGKICAGGICVEKPELNGLEILINSNF